MVHFGATDEAAGLNEVPALPDAPYLGTWVMKDKGEDSLEIFANKASKLVFKSGRQPGSVVRTPYWCASERVMISRLLIPNKGIYFDQFLQSMNVGIVMRMAAKLLTPTLVFEKRLEEK